jgi:hypothetical protein
MEMPVSPGKRKNGRRKKKTGNKPKAKKANKIVFCMCKTCKKKVKKKECIEGICKKCRDKEKEKEALEEKKAAMKKKKAARISVSKKASQKRVKRKKAPAVIDKEKIKSDKIKAQNRKKETSGPLRCSINAGRAKGHLKHYIIITRQQRGDLPGVY